MRENTHQSVCFPPSMTPSTTRPYSASFGVGMVLDACGVVSISNLELTVTMFFARRSLRWEGIARA